MNNLFTPSFIDGLTGIIELTSTDENDAIRCERCDSIIEHGDEPQTLCRDCLVLPALGVQTQCEVCHCVLDANRQAFYLCEPCRLEIDSRSQLAFQCTLV